jgi:hypothetical protein
MEEIAIVISSLAGACTAVALDKIPRYKYNKQALTVNSAIESQLHSSRIEKEILTKTITRLHQESNLSKVQRDKLLIRYQHQLGINIAKIDKLETASKYPDLGPIGDSIITLMDNKLSKLDQRLHEISSKISVSTTQPSMQPTVKTTLVKQQEQPTQIVQEKSRIEKMEIKTEIQNENVEPLMPPIEIPIPQRHRSVELSTLTEIPSKMPEFPAEFIKLPQTPVEKVKIISEPVIEFVEQSQQIPSVEPTTPLMPKEEPVSDPPKLGVEQVERKVQLPSPIKIPEEEKIEDDDKDLDKIKSEIMKALSKLEQVEVE